MRDAWSFLALQKMMDLSTKSRWYATGAPIQMQIASREPSDIAFLNSAIRPSITKRKRKGVRDHPNVFLERVLRTL